MTQFLPPNLLALFQARDPIPFLPPTDKLTYEKKRQPYTGIADYLDHFEDPEETPEPVKPETKLQKLERKRRERAEQNAYKLEQDLALWNPTAATASEQQSTSDAYRTLFVSRINYDTSESKLKREFEVYGKIKQIKMIADINTGKPRGYAFIEYEEEADMHGKFIFFCIQPPANPQPPLLPTIFNFS
jgi:U1 small nuclear ribonucleoprotein